MCLITDCWTYIQNLNYLTLTAHFVDNDWKLQKRFLNFSLIPNHKGETIGKHVEDCLNEWGLQRGFTVRLDNAASNDNAIKYLKRRKNSSSNLVLDGELLHVRCCAHNLNLVVKDGLHDVKSSIASICNAVRFVRSSPSRLAKFKSCVD